MLENFGDAIAQPRGACLKRSSCFILGRFFWGFLTKKLGWGHVSPVDFSIWVIIGVVELILCIFLHQ
eukprot:10375743-Ditylum_brightwellii.AAC.1